MPVPNHLSENTQGSIVSRFSSDTATTFAPLEDIDFIDAPAPQPEGETPPSLPREITHIAGFETTFMTVSQWCVDSMDRYVNEQEFREYQVTEFSRYKRRDDAQCEYIVAKVIHPLHDVQHIKIERGFWSYARDESKLSQNQLRAVPLPTSRKDMSQRFMNIVLRPLIRAMSPVYSADFVTFWGPHLLPNTVADHRIERKVLSLPLPLVHLAILAEVVHEEDPYNLVPTLSYWYSSMIARVIARDNTSTEGESVPNAEVYYTMNTDGRWILVPRPDMVSAIQDEYRARRDRFDEARIFSSL